MAFAGLFGGVLLGLAARLGRFCTLGAIEDLYYGENSVRFAMWGIALGVAVMGTFGLVGLGALDLPDTLYLSQGWNPVASIVGGLMFGYGMALAGNCGYGALARMGCGDLRSFLIVIVMGIAAYVALGGPLSSLRLALFPVAQAGPTSPGIVHLLADHLPFGIPAIGVTLGALILVGTLLNRRLRQSPMSVLWGGGRRRRNRVGLAFHAMDFQQRLRGQADLVAYLYRARGRNPALCDDLLGQFHQLWHRIGSGRGAWRLCRLRLARASAVGGVRRPA